MNTPDITQADRAMRQSDMDSFTRRHFLRAGTVGAAGALLAPAWLSEAMAAQPQLFTALGTTGSVGKAADIKGCGADYLVASVAEVLNPQLDDAAFAQKLDLVKKSPLPVVACNSFIRPKELKCIGPKPTTEAVLAWADTCFKRARKAGMEFIVFGSSGARQRPDGWSKEKADEQFVALLKAMGPLAAAQNIVVAVELLRAQECNYLNHVSEVANVIARANHPNVRVLADLYHMACGGDTPEDLLKAVPLTYCIEIAEKEKRTAPGVAGDDFRPYFAALKKGGYRGRITIEGKWDLPQLKTAFTTIRRQEAEAKA